MTVYMKDKTPLPPTKALRVEYGIDGGDISEIDKLGRDNPTQIGVVQEVKAVKEEDTKLEV